MFESAYGYINYLNQPNINVYDQSSGRPDQQGIKENKHPRESALQPTKDKKLLGLNLLYRARNISL